MGWPNNDPNGWDKVERSAVKTWMLKELRVFYGADYPEPEDLLIWFQAEHSEVFRALVECVPAAMLNDHEADYLEEKYGQ